MGEDNSIAALRLRVSGLVRQEGVLLTRAFEASREGGDRQGVDALFAEVQALQLERNRLQKQIWQPGVYDYRDEPGQDAVRVRVTKGPLGLQVQMPGRSQPVNIEGLDGSFDGPVAGDGSG